MADSEVREENVNTLSPLKIDDIPEKKNDKAKKTNLSLTPNRFNRHPSAIHLAEQKEDNNYALNPPVFNGVNVILANPDKKDSSYTISFNTVEEKFYNQCETYFMENFDKSTPKKMIEESKGQSTKYNSFSGFTNQQKLFDEQITGFIQNGDGYDQIEIAISNFHNLKKV